MHDPRDLQRLPARGPSVTEGWNSSETHSQVLRTKFMILFPYTVTSRNAVYQKSKQDCLWGQRC
jgi:hypothetical protein